MKVSELLAILEKIEDKNMDVATSQGFGVFPTEGAEVCVHTHNDQRVFVIH